MTKTKYLIKRIEKLEMSLDQPFMKCRNKDWLWLRNLCKEFWLDEIIKIQSELNELLKRNFTYVELKQKNVEQLYATNE